MSDNKNAVEMHGCIVCARIYNILAIYTPDGGLVDCAVPDEQQPLVACDTHTVEEIEAAYKRWQSRKGTTSDNEQEDE